MLETRCIKLCGRGEDMVEDGDGTQTRRDRNDGVVRRVRPVRVRTGYCKREW